MKQFSKTNLKPWELALVEKYPLVFTENDDSISRYNPDKDDYVNLRHGFEHDEGWAKLINELGETATALVTMLRANGHPDACIHGFICKKKFGALRWQGIARLPKPFDDLWRAYELDIERLSEQTCEVTGNPGRLCTKDGWIKTLCEEEANKRGFSVYAR